MDVKQKGVARIVVYYAKRQALGGHYAVYGVVQRGQNPRPDLVQVNVLVNNFLIRHVLQAEQGDTWTKRGVVLGDFLAVCTDIIDHQYPAGL